MGDIPDYRTPSKNPVLSKREAGWSVPARRAPLVSYNALEDDGLWHYFGNPVFQPHLHRMGFLSSNGELRDIDKHRRKWHVMEHELFLAERIDYAKQRDAEVLMDQQIKLRQIARYQQLRDAEVQRVVHAIRDKRRQKHAEARMPKTRSMPALGH